MVGHGAGAGFDPVQVGCRSGAIGSSVRVVLLSLIWESRSGVTPTGLPRALNSTIRLSLIASELLLTRLASSI
jgi:hypothetical protein